MAWLVVISLSTWIPKSMQFAVSGSILFLPPYPLGEKKNIWFELELNPGPLASQATALATRPWHLGQINYLSYLSLDQVISATRSKVIPLYL